MKIIRISFLLLFISIGWNNNVYAQSDHSEKTRSIESAEALTNWMKSSLSLDSTITANIFKINLKYAKKNQDIASSGVGRSKKLRELNALTKSKDKELKKTLTKEQYKEYLKDRAKLPVEAMDYTKEAKVFVTKGEGNKG